MEFLFNAIRGARTSFEAGVVAKKSVKIMEEITGVILTSDDLKSIQTTATQLGQSMVNEYSFALTELYHFYILRDFTGNIRKKMTPAIREKILNFYHFCIDNDVKINPYTKEQFEKYESSLEGEKSNTPSDGVSMKSKSALTPEKLSWGDEFNSNPIILKLIAGYEKISPELVLSFKEGLIKANDLNKINEIGNRVEHQYLELNFGNDQKIHDFVRKLSAEGKAGQIEDVRQFIKKEKFVDAPELINLIIGMEDLDLDAIAKTRILCPGCGRDIKRGDLQLSSAGSGWRKCPACGMQFSL